MSQFLINDTPIAGLKVIERVQYWDARGFLSRLFCAEELSEAGWHKEIAQTNHTHTRKKATVRGLHFQHPPHAGKNVSSEGHGLRGLLAGADFGYCPG